MGGEGRSVFWTLGRYLILKKSGFGLIFCKLSLQSRHFLRCISGQPNVTDIALFVLCSTSTKSIVDLLKFPQKSSLLLFCNNLVIESIIPQGVRGILQLVMTYSD